jgi:hypothetical protein
LYAVTIISAQLSIDILRSAVVAVTVSVITGIYCSVAAAQHRNQQPNRADPHAVPDSRYDDLGLHGGSYQQLVATTSTYVPRAAASGKNDIFIFPRVTHF